MLFKTVEKLAQRSQNCSMVTKKKRNFRMFIFGKFIILTRYFFTGSIKLSLAIK